MIFLICFIMGHDLEYLYGTDDWLNGGEYVYQCKRCGKIKTAQPWKGFW